MVNMGYYRRALQLVRDEGWFHLAGATMALVYNRYVVPFLPREEAVYNGVPVYASRKYDSWVPWRQKDRPNYESAIVSSIDDHVIEGDTVVIVGGGWGVSAVKSARKVAEDGEVLVYEGSASETMNVRETAELNSLADRIRVNHAVVGPVVKLRGDASGADRISPRDLPACDVLELDCEGSEIDILTNLAIRPRVIIVESHGMNGAPTSDIERILREMSYDIKSIKIADDGLEDVCVTNDIYTITAVDGLGG